MEEENKHIDELIANYLTEGLDKNALDELKTWIAASAENQQYFIRQREIWFVKPHLSMIRIKRLRILETVSKVRRKFRALPVKVLTCQRCGVMLRLLQS
jgi:hypothetical protein